MSGAGELKHGHFFEVVAAAAVLVAAFGEDYVTCGARWLRWGGAS